MITARIDSVELERERIAIKFSLEGKLTMEDKERSKIMYFPITSSIEEISDAIKEFIRPLSESTVKLEELESELLGKVIS
jgi:hypothetical protein